MTEGDDWRGAVRLIAINPSLRRECEEIAPSLAAATRPTTPEETLEILIRNAPAFNIPGRRKEEWRTLFGAYLDALAPLPVQAIEEAFLKWNRAELYPNDPGRHGFFPRPAEVFSLADRARIAIGNAAYRARHAVEFVENYRPPPTDEDKAKVRAMLAEMKAPSGRPGFEARRMPGANVSHETPQQMAARMRRADEEPI